VHERRRREVYRRRSESPEQIAILFVGRAQDGPSARTTSTQQMRAPAVLRQSAAEAAAAVRPATNVDPITPPVVARTNA